MSVQFEDVRLRLPHVELAARLYGPEDGQPCIALHGWLDNLMSFSKLAPHLRGLRILALDQAGHGHSSHRAPGGDYHIWDYAYDLLEVSEQMGWKRFSLLGHSMGAIVSALFSGTMPERVERLVLIDGLIPFTGEPETAPQKLADAFIARQGLARKRKPVYATIDEAVAARMKGVAAVSQEAAELLAQRGLTPVPKGYTWRTDPRLMLPSVLRLTQAHAWSFVDRIQCPRLLIAGKQGMLVRQPDFIAEVQKRPIELVCLPGGHHLHLDNDAGAQAVADCINQFFAKA